MSRPGCRRAASPGSMISPPLPSAQLFPAVVATQIVAVFDVRLRHSGDALPWTLVGIVWAYVVVWTILTDLVHSVASSGDAADRAQHGSALITSWGHGSAAFSRNYGTALRLS